LSLLYIFISLAARLLHVFFSQFPLSHDGGPAQRRNDRAWVTDYSGGDEEDNNTSTTRQQFDGARHLGKRQRMQIPNPNIAIIEQIWPVFELGVYRAAHRPAIEVSTESKGGATSVDGGVGFHLQRLGLVFGGFLRDTRMTIGGGLETVCWTTVTEAVHSSVGRSPTIVSLCMSVFITVFTNGMRNRRVQSVYGWICVCGYMSMY
ncbi:hypothetical protein Dimus_018294, partial [Dionaea muscipula]